LVDFSLRLVPLKDSLRHHLALSHMLGAQSPVAGFGGVPALLASEWLEFA
jgi:hypothetical protein